MTQEKAVELVNKFIEHTQEWDKMTGNILILIKTFFNQHLFCFHNYKWVHRKDNGADFEICSKCDLIK